MSEERSDAAARALRQATAGGQPRASKPKAGKPAKTAPRRSGRDPLLLGQAVDDLLSDRGWTQTSTAASLGARWAEIVGPDIAEHVEIESFTDGRLLLRAASTAWATQLRLLLPRLRETIDDALGKGVIADISVVGPQAPSWSAGQRRVKGRGPRDTYG